MSKFNHSIKVPTQYKVTARILKTAIEQKKPIRSLLVNEKHVRPGKVQTVLNLYCENREAIDNAIEVTGLLKDNPNLDWALAKVLTTELIFASRELNGESKPVQKVRSYKERLQQAINGTENQKTVNRTERSPRYVRINTNLVSIPDALDVLYDENWRRKQVPANIQYSDFLTAVRELEDDEFLMDMHVEGLLIFHSKHHQYWVSHKYVRTKKFILQNKGTCLATTLLAPPVGATVLDMCAAPGMKTLHICNEMQNQGRIYAVEQSMSRYETLRQITNESGCRIVDTIRGDCLALDPTAFADVEYILVDPSCSGSGIRKRLTFFNEEKNDDRLYRLAGLQIKILCHAMKAFPNVKRIVYCTCSLWQEENEQVVQVCLERNPSFKLLSCKKALRNKWQNVGDKTYVNIGKNCLYCLPDYDLTDGIFLAMFEKRQNDEP